MTRKANYSASINQLTLLRMLLESYFGIISFDDIIERLDISRKTLNRYLAVLEQVFGDIISVKTGAELGRGSGRDRYLEFKRYALESRTGYQLAPLYLSRFFMSFLEGTLLDESLEDAVSIFESAVEMPGADVHVGGFNQKFFAFSLGPKSYAEHDQTIEEILKAVIKQNPLTVRYQKPGSAAPGTYELHPYTLLMYKQGLYLIAKSEHHKRPRFFAVERIVEISRQSDKVFDYPLRYRPEKLVQGSFGLFSGKEVLVRLYFDATVPGEYVKTRRWHATQEVIRQQDGAHELSMRVAEGPELTSWILSFGAGVTVLEPEALRRRVAGEAHQMARKYSDI